MPEGRCLTLKGLQEHARVTTPQPRRKFCFTKQAGCQQLLSFIPTFFHFLTLFGTILSGLSACLYSSKLKALVSELTCESKCAGSKQVMMWSEKKSTEKADQVGDV